MSEAIVDNGAIRMYLMDRPEWNTLLDGTQFTEAQINAAMLFTVSFFNESNPPAPVFYSISSFPFFYGLLTGTTGFLLRSASFNQAINNLEYSSDNTSINDKNKADVFFKLGSTLWAEYKELCTNLKTNENAASCYGAVGSEWATRAYVS